MVWGAEHKNFCGKTMTHTVFDGISVKLMKKVKFQILNPLAHIINLSFSQGKIPDSLKIAKVVPIYKKGDCSLFLITAQFQFYELFPKSLKNWLTHEY